mgnify:CR=1 FL=1|tara:strand:- start:100 stop:1194 length:1095 start_codon:yes stop_codon:yes gene_type:complete
MTNFDKVHSSDGVAVNLVAAEPTSGRKDDDGKFIKTCPTMVTQDGWTIMTWKGENGGPGGYALTNGVSALLFDENGNVKTSTGKPGDTGCGGKIVNVCTDFIDKGHTYAGQFTGSSQERSKDGKTEELPAYSLHVNGETAIESIGADVNILGDNVTIQARKTLTLKAGTGISIEAGLDKDGNCSGRVDLKALRTTVASDFWTEESKSHKVEMPKKGEYTINQKGAGSKIAFNTDGGITTSAKGEINYHTDKVFRVDAKGNIVFGQPKGAAGASFKVNGKYSEEITGTRYTEIKGQPPKGGKADPTGWEIKIAKSMTTGLKIDSALGLDAKFKKGMNYVKFLGGKTLIQSSKALEIKSGAEIKLN